MIQRKLLTALVLLAVLAMTGCEDIAEMLTQDASWSYVQQHYQGLLVGPNILTGGRLVFEVAPRAIIDKGNCLQGLRASREGRRIRVSFKPGDCPFIRRTPQFVDLAVWELGEYTVVYDDPAAGFPVVGEVHVD